MEEQDGGVWAGTLGDIDEGVEERAVAGELEGLDGGGVRVVGGGIGGEGGGKLLGGKHDR